LRRLINHLFSTKSSIAILIIIFLCQCSNTTTIVQTKHHLLSRDSTSTIVCFLRTKTGASGAYGKLIEIKLDGEKLLELNKGQYTFLPLKSGKYNMMLTSWTVVPGDSQMIQTSRNFVLDLAEADSVNLLFMLEKMTFGQIMSQAGKQFMDTIGEKANQKLDDVSIPIWKDVAINPFQRESTLEDRSKGKHHNGRGYTVEIINSSMSKLMENNLVLVQGFH